jgi:hypothetical protein
VIIVLTPGEMRNAALVAEFRAMGCQVVVSKKLPTKIEDDKGGKRHA